MCSGVAYLGQTLFSLFQVIVLLHKKSKMLHTAPAATETFKIKRLQRCYSDNLIISVLGLYSSPSVPHVILTLMPDHQLRVRCGHQSHSARPHHLRPPPS